MIDDVVRRSNGSAGTFRPPARSGQQLSDQLGIVSPEFPPEFPGIPPKLPEFAEQQGALQRRAEIVEAVTYRLD